MATKLLKSIRLENTTGGHDKFYYMELREKDGTYIAYRQWGRNPFAVGKGQSATSHHTKEWEARMVLEDYRGAKVRKGYEVVHTWMPPVPVAKAESLATANAGEEVFGF